MRGCSGVVNSKKFRLIKCFSTDFTPKATDLPSIFRFASIWSCKAASKSEALKSTLLYKSCSNQKILADFIIPILKVSVTNPQGLFDLSNFYISKLISEPLTLRPPCSSRLRPNKKCLVDQLLFAVKSVEKHLIRKNFFQLTPTYM